MKLSSFQKKIVDHIIAGDIYDIPSYLRVFGKGHDKQYDIKDIEKEFSIYEDGMTYIFRKKEDNSFYTEVYNKSGNLEKSFPVANRHTIELYSNPITEPVSAQLEMIGPIEEVYYNDKKFQFVFLKNEYFVADSFSEIKDFVALWSYLNNNPANILKNRYNKLFQEDQPYEIYYLSYYLFAIFLELSNTNTSVFNGFVYKLRFYIIMVARCILANASTCPAMNSKDMKSELRTISNICLTDPTRIKDAITEAKEIVCAVVDSNEGYKSALNNSLRSPNFNLAVLRATKSYLEK